MTRCTPILIMCVALITACSSPRKACRKADRYIARAVWLCPDVLARDSATVTSQPDSATFTAAPSQADMDSLLAACRTLNAALMAARTDFPVQKQAAALPRANAVAHAVAQLQRAACDWKPFTEHFGRISIEVRNQGGTPLLILTDPGEVRKVPCPPTVNKTVITGVAEWYRTFFWLVIACLLSMLGVWCVLVYVQHR